MMPWPQEVAAFTRLFHWLDIHLRMALNLSTIHCLPVWMALDMAVRMACHTVEAVFFRLFHWVVIQEIIVCHRLTKKVETAVQTVCHNAWNHFVMAPQFLTARMIPATTKAIAIPIKMKGQMAARVAMAAVPAAMAQAMKAATRKPAMNRAAVISTPCRSAMATWLCWKKETMEAPTFTTFWIAPPTAESAFSIPWVLFSQAMNPCTMGVTFCTSWVNTGSRALPTVILSD